MPYKSKIARRKYAQQYGHQWYLAHKIQVQERTEAWKKANKDKCKIYRQHQYQKEKAMLQNNTKVCYGCGERKPLHCYYRQKTRLKNGQIKEGYATRCIECKKIEYTKRNSNNNPIVVRTIKTTRALPPPPPPPRPPADWSDYDSQRKSICNGYSLPNELADAFFDELRRRVALVDKGNGLGDI